MTQRRTEEELAKEAMAIATMVYEESDDMADALVKLGMAVATLIGFAAYNGGPSVDEGTALLAKAVKPFAEHMLEAQQLRAN